MFLAPETSNNTDTQVYEAKPIQSIAPSKVSGGIGTSGLVTDRIATGFDDGSIDGTANGDPINAKYGELFGSGTDKKDNNDAGAVGSGNNDIVRAVAGNDTVYANMGNDTVYGGDGNDLVYGGDSHDSLLGEASDDTLSGGAGNDSLSGGT